MRAILTLRECFSEYALQTGAVNLIDTSPNYGVESESMVGMTLRNLMDANRIAREEIIVTTKIGPLRQGGALDAVKARAAKGRPFANMTLLTPEIGYCWDPEYIEFQLTKTLKTMQLDCIDLVMIDTPELLLPEKSNENVIGQLYRMLQGAMAHLEQEVKRGRIQYYGVSSSILRALHRVSDTPSLSLDMILRTANTLGSGDANKHHFAAVEYPMNLIEPHCAHNDVTTSAEGTAHIWSQMGRDSSVQLMAYEAGLLQFAVRPLNTLIETKDIFTHIPQPQHSLEPTGMLYRLTVPPMHDGAALAPRIKATINGCVGLEQSYALEYSKTVNKPAPPPKASTTPPLPPLPHPKEFCWAQIVIANLSRLDLETFKVSWKVQMKPGITASLATLRKACPDLEFWANNYEKGMNTLAEQYTQVLEINRASELEEFSSALIDCCPSLAENPSLSSKAVRVVGSTLASSTLVGMRTEKYVTDIVYGGGTPESPNSMLPIDPSLLGSIFDAGSRHMDFIRSNLKTQLASEEETAVNARREAAEERIMSEALAPRPPPPPRSSGSNPK